MRMNEPAYEISQLILAYLKGALPESGERELQQWLAASPQHQALFDRLTAAGTLEQELQQIASVNTAAARGKLVSSLFPAEEQAPVVRRMPARHRWSRVAAAAVFLLLATGVYTWFRATQSRTTTVAVKKLPEIMPGKEGAVLVLADGRQVRLDSMANGVVAAQNGASAVLTNGQLTYTVTDAGTGATAYNTMYTPKGRQFHLQLPDGTGVWLNAASSIRYPVVFTGGERKVDITGEAYFEVAKNITIPFRINASNRAVIEVLGTHLNINAYDNEESLNTTLIEGAVRVSRGADSVLLSPGQQARVAATLQVVKQADLDKVMAWKNGVFNFENAGLAEVMRQLERWYDITVIYEKGIPNVYFIGEISRGMSLGDVLTTMEKTGVHFRMQEDRTLIVMP
jgi:ferric-dicitrate binding protein FerR (iron transport regulator)